MNTTRSTHQRWKRWVAPLAVAAIGLTACSKDETGGTASSASGGSAPTATTSAASTASSAAGQTAETTSASTAGGEVQLTDDYSKQIAKNKTVDVDTSQYKKTAPFKVATIVQGPINGWGTIFDATMDEAMKQSGKFDMTARMYVPWNFDVANQSKGIDDAIAQKVDGIMLTSLSRAGLAASVERATAAGIPVVLCMAGAATDQFTAEVSADMPRMGYESAKAVAEKIGGKGKVVMINGIAGVDAAEFWRNGAKTAFAEYPDIKIVAEQNANWSTADALEVMRNILVQQPEIDAIWAGGFEMGVGIVDAYQEAGKDVPFIGGTGITNGFLKLAKEQNLDFFAVQFPPGGSSKCVDTLVDVLEGNSVKKFTDVVSVLEGTGPITSNNVDEFLKPQFNDDFIGPEIYGDDVYKAAGF